MPAAPDPERGDARASKPGTLRGMAVEEVTLRVYVPSWEVDCCRVPPRVGQAWGSVVGIGSLPRIRRDEPAPGIVAHDDGTTTVVGRVVRLLTSSRSTASVIDAGRLRVVVPGGGAVGATCEARGQVWEDRHSFGETQDEAAACRNSGGVIVGVHLIPDRIESIDGVPRRRIGSWPGVEVDAVERYANPNCTIVLDVTFI